MGETRDQSRRFYARYGKRVMDVGGSAVALVLLSPLLMVTSILVKATSHGPVFFVQERPGVRARPFKILKFRSMRTFDDSYDANGNELGNEARVTGVGAVLRRTSIDELPQLLNVLVGHMSLVGPRPALSYQVKRYDSEQRRRLDVRPGMTGLAQVSGRNSLTWEEKITLDLAYVRNVGLALDVSILARTIRVVLSGAGLRFEKHDELSEHDGELRRHVGERRRILPIHAETDRRRSDRAHSTKIVYLHQYYRTPRQGGGTRTYEFSRRLVDRGFEVHVVTSSRDGRTGGGWTHEVVEGVHVHSIVVPYSNKFGFRRRLVAFARFALYSGMKARQLAPDVVFATSTPLTIIFPAIHATLFRRIPLIFEVRDLWPELPIAVGALRNPLLRAAASAMERLAYFRATEIIALSPGMADGVRRVVGSRRRVTVVPNGSDTRLFRSVTEERASEWRASRPWLDGANLVSYTGTLGKINGVGYLARLAKACDEHGADIKFLVIGDGFELESVRLEAMRLGVLNKNFFMQLPVAKDEIAIVLANTTVALSLFLPIPAMEANSANKFFDALAAGRPVAVNYGGWQAEILRESGAGIALDPYDLHRAARTLIDFIESPVAMKRSGRAAAVLGEGRFNRDVLFEDFLGAFERARRSHVRTYDCQ